MTQSVFPISPLSLSPLSPPTPILRGVACWVTGTLMTGWEGAFLCSEEPWAHLPLRQSVI